MTAIRRWFRLDVTWSSSAWLVPLRPGGRLAWVELLGFVKAYGVGGRVKALPPAAAGKRWNITTKDVDAMVAAAMENGALRIEDGDWVITGWTKYQENDRTAAERMRRHRAAKQEKSTTSGLSRRNARNVRRNPSRDSDVDVDSDSDSDRTPSPTPTATAEGGRMRSRVNPEPHAEPAADREAAIMAAEPMARRGINRMRQRDDEGDVLVTLKGGEQRVVGYGACISRWRWWARTRSEEPAILARALWHVHDLIDVEGPMTVALVLDNGELEVQAIHRALEETPVNADLVRQLVPNLTGKRAS